MISFTNEEKCAMLVAITQIGSIQDSRKDARTVIMMRYQDMLGIGTFEMMEYTNTKLDNIMPTLQAMSSEKKKYYVQMMIALMIEDGQIVESERKAFMTLISACRIPENVVKEAMEETLGRKL